MSDKYTVTHLDDSSHSSRIEKSFASLEATAKYFVSVKDELLPIAKDAIRTLVESYKPDGQFIHKSIQVDREDPFFKAYYKALSEHYQKHGAFSNDDIQKIAVSKIKHAVDDFVQRRAIDLVRCDVLNNKSLHNEATKILLDAFGDGKGVASLFSKTYQGAADGTSLNFDKNKVSDFKKGVELIQPKLDNTAGNKLGKEFNFSMKH